MTSIATDLQRWLPYRKVGADAQVRLFCFAHAGGAGSVFRDWSDKLPKHVEVCAIQLPGRESRLVEQSFTRMGELTDALLPVIAPLLDRPFALFGYSLGAAIAFETARLTSTAYGANPTGLFVCARRAPHLPSHLEAAHLLPEPAFKNKLRALGGTPEEALANDELLELIMPALRADFELNETVFAGLDFTDPAAEKLNCPIRAYGGLGDAEVSVADLEAWKDCTHGAFSLRLFQGTHFFLKQNLSAILAEIKDALPPPQVAGDPAAAARGPH